MNNELLIVKLFWPSILGISHSLPLCYYLQKAPVMKGFVRGVSKLTGYVVRMVDAESCVLTYVTQVDFKGM